MNLPIYRQTKTCIPVVLDEMRPDETEKVRTLFNQIVLEGNSYPQSKPLTAETFASYWLKGNAFVVRLSSEAQLQASDNVIAAFYIKPNFPGRCSHICNAGFIVAPEMRGQGLGRLMGEAMLELAQSLGYRAVMYNLVFETNVPSLKIWESMGFQEIGRIPEAARLENDRYVDAVMLYKSLV